MKQKILFGFMALMACGLTLTSCSDNDDDNGSTINTL